MAPLTSCRWLIMQTRRLFLRTCRQSPHQLMNYVRRSWPCSSSWQRWRKRYSSRTTAIFRCPQCQRRHTTPQMQRRQRRERSCHRHHHHSSPPNTTAHGAEGEGQRADVEADTGVDVEAGAVAGTAQDSSHNRPNLIKEEEQYQPWSHHHSRRKLEGNRIA